MPELHTPPQEIFPTLALLFPWSLTFLQILEPRIHSDMGQGWAYQEQGLRHLGLPSNPYSVCGDLGNVFPCSGVSSQGAVERK